jgi:dethiobiotin synthetase
VGKTWFTAQLVRAWRARGLDAAALKPIAAGDRDDAETLRAAADGTLTLDEINPIHLRLPAAPLLAAREEKRALDFRALNDHIAAMRKRFPHLAVEGVGGWRVPLAPGYEVSDWARELALPVVVVARAGVGTLNHTLLTVDSIRAAGLTCLGVVLNPGPAPATLPDFDVAAAHDVLLHELLGLPTLQLHGGTHAAVEIPVWLGGE